VVQEGDMKKEKSKRRMKIVLVNWDQGTAPDSEPNMRMGVLVMGIKR